MSRATADELESQVHGLNLSDDEVDTESDANTPADTPAKAPPKAQKGLDSVINKVKETGTKTKPQPIGSMGTQLTPSHVVSMQGRVIGATVTDFSLPEGHEELISKYGDAYLDALELEDTRRPINVEGLMEATSTGYEFTEMGQLENIDLSTARVGFGKPKRGQAGNSNKDGIYRDVVLVVRNPTTGADSVLPQFMCTDCVVEGITARPRTGKAVESARRLGEHFLRVGIPKAYFGPIMNTVREFCGAEKAVGKVTEFNGYYWVNASWGVSSNPATYAWMVGNDITTTGNLAHAMEHLAGRSAIGAMVLAISISSTPEVNAERVMTENRKNASLSVKCHNFLEFRPTNIRGPPQIASAGMKITDSMKARMQPAETRAGVPSTIGNPPLGLLPYATSSVGTPAGKNILTRFT